MIRDFAEIWRGAKKIVFSRTLQTVASARTDIERTCDPDAVRRVKEAAGADITVGGAELAGQAIAAELVDELHLFLGGDHCWWRQRALPDDIRVPLARLEERRFRTASFTSTTASPADRDDNPAVSSHTRCRG